MRSLFLNPDAALPIIAACAYNSRKIPRLAEMNTPADPPRFHSTCPHDCPSTCAIEVEKIDSHTIGRVYGADNSYTQGVVCAKVARYAERIHHPQRLGSPLRRTNKKSASGEFEKIDWDDALDLSLIHISEPTRPY